MRAQSHVIGAVLMLSLAVVALGTLTLAVGTVLESQAANTDAERVASAMDDTLTGVERSGYYSHRVTFAEGRISTEPRQMRILANGSVVANITVDAVVYQGNDRRVAALGGAVIRGKPGTAWLASEPPITGSERNGVILIGVPVLDAAYTSITGQGGVTVTFETNVSHSETDLGVESFAIAIETQTPAPFERYFQAQNATTERRQFAGDRTESVVAQYPGNRQGYLVLHNLSLEVE